MSDNVLTLIVAVLASSGLWAVVNTIIIRRHKKKDDKKEDSEKAEQEIKEALKELQKSNILQQEMLKGLAHDKILSLGKQYIKRGYITSEEYDNLYNYIYKPAVALNIDGSSKRIMEKIQSLPINEKDA